MSRIFWDTSLSIYLIEDRGELSERVVRIHQRMLSRKDQLYTSTLTLGEVLVKPTEANEEPLRRSYESALAGGAVLIPLDRGAAPRYTSIRSDRTIRPPDAIQLARAAEAAVDLLVTNDDRLSAKIVPGIHFIASLERAFL